MKELTALAGSERYGACSDVEVRPILNIQIKRTHDGNDRTGQR